MLIFQFALNDILDFLVAAKNFLDFFCSVPNGIICLAGDCRNVFFVQTNDI